MDWTIDACTAEVLLMQYSEWLDVEDVNPRAAVEASDPRTHEDLVRQFIIDRNVAARPKVLCACGPGEGCIGCRHTRDGA